MNVMNVVNMSKSATFMPQAYESKGRLNVMNVVRKYFASGARELPNVVAVEEGSRDDRANPNLIPNGIWD